MLVPDLVYSRCLNIISNRAVNKSPDFRFPQLMHKHRTGEEINGRIEQSRGGLYLQLSVCLQNGVGMLDFAFGSKLSKTKGENSPDGLCNGHIVYTYSALQVHVKRHMEQICI